MNSKSNQFGTVTRPQMLQALNTCGARDTNSNLNVAFHICTELSFCKSSEIALERNNHLDNDPKITAAFTEQIFLMLNNSSEL